jgi:cytidylate kinase
MRVRHEITHDDDMTVIAMTREIGSLGTHVAAGLASALGIRIIDSEIVLGNVAGSLGVEQSTVQNYLAGSASMFERWQINKRKLSRYTSEQILSLAQQGNVLIRGWGAAALFRGIPQVISVRVCAPMTFRERVMKERLGVNDADAIREEIERYDAAHASTMRASFNLDREDARLYHIVLNTGLVPIDACVKTICQLALDPRFQDDATTRSVLTDKLLEIKVNAALTEHLGIEMATITVSTANGTIVLDGRTSNGGLRARAENLAREIEGVRDIDNRIISAPNRGRF